MPSRPSSRRKPTTDRPSAPTEAAQLELETAVPREASEAPPPPSAPAAPLIRRVSKKLTPPRPARDTSGDSTPPTTEPAAPFAETAADIIEVLHETRPTAFDGKHQPREQESEPPDVAGDAPWPEPETVGASEGEGGGSKRKRRRRKGKNKGQPQSAAFRDEAPQPAAAPAVPAAPAAPAAPADPDDQDDPEPSDAAPSPAFPRPPHQPRVKLDQELLAKFAWKIYLAEVSEEGIALINDREARDVSRRCFRLAEIFLEEQARQCGGRNS